MSLLPTPPAIRETLLQRLEETLRRAARVAGRLRHADALPDDWTDRAPLLADEEVLVGLDEEARAEIVALRQALSRLDDGSYGVCVLCGQSIAPARLAALPTATTCVDCAE